MGFGQRLKSLRQERGLSQEDLAKLTGISSRVIGYYESGERFPHTEEALVNIARAFEVSLDFLLDNPVRSDSFCPSRYCYMKTMTSEDKASVNQFIRYLKALRQEKKEIAESLKNAGSLTTPEVELDQKLKDLIDRSAPQP